MIGTNLRGGKFTVDRRLDRLPSDVTEHLEKYPLTASTRPETCVPVVAGSNWYTGMDQPVQRRVNGRLWHVLDGRELGLWRGGHAYCLRPWDTPDVLSWWRHYDQGTEGRCVEFAVHRALSLMNRRKYDTTSAWLYHTAQRLDEWEGGSYPGALPVYEGTSVRAGLDVARKYGAIRARRGGVPYDGDPSAYVSQADGIARYRWVRDWSDVRRVLGVPDDLPGVPLLNSWGTDYPRETLLMDDLGARLLAEDGEFGVPTDR